MQSSLPKCTKEVGEKKTCIICDKNCIANDLSKTFTYFYRGDYIPQKLKFDLL